MMSDEDLSQEQLLYRREDRFIRNHLDIRAENSLFRQAIALCQTGEHRVNGNPLENLENSFGSQEQLFEAFDELPCAVQFEIKEKMALLIVQADARETHFFENVVGDQIQENDPYGRLTLEEERRLVGESCVFARAVRAEVQAQRA